MALIKTQWPLLRILFNSNTEIYFKSVAEARLESVGSHKPARVTQHFIDIAKLGQNAFTVKQGNTYGQS